MSKRLYLLRHAKSSWKQPELTDHERPLAGRGRRAAAAIARHLDQCDIAPELVLCSTARRARETLERIQPAFPAAAVEYEPGLYAASADALLERVQGLPDAVSSVLLIGHNPEIEELARASPGRRELEIKFPTAALATLEFAGPNWRNARRGAATLVDFARPAELET